MKYILTAIFALWSAATSAFEIRLDSEVWVKKLNQLCIAAAYGSRMTAEPICNELNDLYMKGASDAKQKSSASPTDGGSSAQPGVR